MNTHRLTSSLYGIFRTEWSRRRRTASQKARICDKCGYVGMTRMEDHWHCPKCGGQAERKTIEDVKLELIQQKAEAAQKSTRHRRNMRGEVRQSLGDERKLNDIIARYGYNPNVIYVWRRIYGDYWKEQRERRAKCHF